VEDDCWSPEGLLDVKPHVVLHDKLISEAVLGGNLPIKTEHSYCTRIFNSDDDNSRDSNSNSFQKMQDGKYNTFFFSSLLQDKVYSKSTFGTLDLRENETRTVIKRVLMDV
jgi:hypothetical protein